MNDNDFHIQHLVENDSYYHNMLIIHTRMYVKFPRTIFTTLLFLYNPCLYWLPPKLLYRYTVLSGMVVATCRNIIVETSSYCRIFQHQAYSMPAPKCLIYIYLPSWHGVCIYSGTSRRFPGVVWGLLCSSLMLMYSLAHPSRALALSIASRMIPLLPCGLPRDSLKPMFATSHKGLSMTIATKRVRQWGYRAFARYCANIGIPFDDCYFTIFGRYPK